MPSCRSVKKEVSIGVSAAPEAAGCCPPGGPCSQGRAALVRGVVTALSEPSRESETRSLLREHFGASKATGLKALLVSAPLEGVDLSRKRDFGRDVEL